MSVKFPFRSIRFPLRSSHGHQPINITRVKVDGKAKYEVRGVKLRVKGLEGKGDSPRGHFVPHQGKEEGQPKISAKKVEV